MLSLCAFNFVGEGHAQNQQPLQPPNLSYYNPDRSTPVVKNLQCDVCIYGGSSAGVATALQVSRNGKMAIIIEPGNHLGGLSASGLGETDIGNKAAIGGIAREFYGRLGKKYGVAEEWTFEPHVAEGVFKEMAAEAKSPVLYRQFLKSVQKQGGRITSITLESGITVSAKMFVDTTYEGDLMAKAGVKYTVGRESNATYNEKLNGVQVHQLHQFDLAVDPYVIEGNPTSGLLTGISPEVPGPVGTGDHKIQAYNFRLCLTNDPANRIPFAKPAGYDPQRYVLLGRYLKAGWPASEVFRKFDPIRNSFNANETENETTPSLQVSDVKDARSLVGKLKRAGGPFTLYLKQQFPSELQTKLNAYDENQTPAPELVQAVVDGLNRQIAGPLFYTPALFAKVQMSAATRQQVTQNLTGEALRRLNVRLLQEAYPVELGSQIYQKVDKNNHGAFSTDFIGENFDYPEADYATRERIFQAHVTYQKGLMWFMGNDPSVPETIRARWSQWGLPRDEFPETGGWPHQLYAREARRMLGGYVMTEKNCRAQEVVNDPVGLAAYTMDSHNVQRFVRDGRVWNEGDVQEKGVLPYPISYRSITPKKAECENLLVPVCLSASHIAYGSIRMEPVFMILGQSAADAATLAIDRGVALQDLPYSELKAKLDAHKQVLQWGKPAVAEAPIANIDAAIKAFFDRLKNGQKQTVVVYGTSLTRNGAWTTAVQNWLDKQYPGQITFFNSGLSGQNSDEGVAQMQDQLLAHKPDLVFIEFAINDAHKKFEMPVERGASNLDQIVRAVRAQNPNSAIVLQVMDVPWDAPNGNRSFSDRPQLQGFNDNYRTYARQHALPLIDHNPDWLRLKDTEPDKYHTYLPDGLHPNKDGDLAVNWPPIEALLTAARDAK
ncbi:hypothetical protein IAD21_03907 [Abditibacteriota bacterium]|nr:hypothetical protein IAD21_03907 [Abditibacteriota bacterium]